MKALGEKKLVCEGKLDEVGEKRREDGRPWGRQKNWGHLGPPA